jgi:hypothetical protein
MALVNPNIAMSYRGVELPQQNALADYAAIQQIQSGQRQAEVSQMQIEQMRRDQAALSKMQAAITAKGGPSDLNVAAEEMINSGIPEYFKQGLVIKQTLDKQSRFAKLLGPTGGAAPAAAPASEPYEGYNESIGMAAPAAAAAPASEPYPGYNQAIGMTNALAPAPAAPVNAMTDLRRKVNEAYMIGTPEALAFAKAGEDQLKPTTDVSSMQALGFPSTPAGFAQFKGAQFAPPAPTDIAKLIKERDALPKGDPNRALYDREIADRNATAENARQRLAFDKNKFNWEKANPGFEIREADDGSVVGVNKRTLQAFPVTIGGAVSAVAPAAGGTGMPSARVSAPQAPLAGATPPAGKPLMGKGQGITEGERKASTLLQRLRFSESQLTKALVDDPDAAKPGVFTSALDMLSTPLANTLTPEARQRVQSAQLDILDAALTLGTGAAYTKEQLEGYRSSYFPAIGDGPTQVKDKKARLQNVISAANIAAGKGAKLVPDASSGANANDPLGLLGGK